MKNSNDQDKQNITRKELARDISGKLGFSQSESREIIDKFLACLKDNLVKGEQIKLVGFGTFNVHHKPPRPGRNPKTGEPVEISERGTVTFKASKRFREIVNSS
ncbi:MAG: integration host factor subunit alpha [Thermodesulfobacteriota bacterium]